MPLHNHVLKHGDTQFYCASEFKYNMGHGTEWKCMPNKQFFTLQLHPVIGEMKLRQNSQSRILITMYSEQLLFLYETK